jgi:hypothetical protein
MQFLNIASFLLALTSDGLSYLVFDFNNDNADYLISPKGWVYWIWAPIYFLQGLFVVYTSLPSIDGRNDELITKSEAWASPISWALLAIWFPLYRSGSFIGVELSGIVIFAAWIASYVRILDNYSYSGYRNDDDDYVGPEAYETNPIESITYNLS